MSKKDPFQRLVKLSFFLTALILGLYIACCSQVAYADDDSDTIKILIRGSSTCAAVHYLKAADLDENGYSKDRVEEEQGKGEWWIGFLQGVADYTDEQARQLAIAQVDYIAETKNLSDVMSAALNCEMMRIRITNEFELEDSDSEDWKYEGPDS